MNYQKMYLWVSAIGLLPIALSYGAIPEQSLSWLFDISVHSTNHTHVFRGVMGLYLAMVAFWILGAVRENINVRRYRARLSSWAVLPQVESPAF
jgi:hypothetical protein